MLAVPRRIASQDLLELRLCDLVRPKIKALGELYMVKLLVIVPVLL